MNFFGLRLYFLSLCGKVCFRLPDVPTINALTYYSINKNNNHGLLTLLWNMSTKYFLLACPFSLQSTHVVSVIHLLSISQYYTCNLLPLKRLYSSPIACICIRIFFFLIIIFLNLIQFKMLFDEKKLILRHFWFGNINYK